MFTLVGWLHGLMWDEGVIEWYQSMVQLSEWMGSVLIMHYVDFMCVFHTYGVFVYCTHVLLAMVVVVSPWKCLWCRCQHVVMCV